MGVAFYWNSHYGDTETEEALRQDPEETQPLWGLACDRTGCVFSDFGEPLSSNIDRIYDSLLWGMVARAWRFPKFYGEFAGEEFSCPTLVMRRRLAQLAQTDRFGAIEQAVFDFATDPARSNDYDLLNGLDDRHLNSLVESPTFEDHAAYDYHRFTALAQVLRRKELRPTIRLVEDVVSPQFWLEVRKRMLAAEGVRPTKHSDGHYVVTGSGGHEYRISLKTLSCTCDDFQWKGRRYGFHCKHLIACLRDAGLWAAWEADLPSAPAGKGLTDTQSASTATIPSRSAVIPAVHGSPRGNGSHCPQANPPPLAQHQPVLRPEVLAALDSLKSRSEIVAAWDYLRRKAKQLSRQQVYSFCPGQRVQFRPRRGPMLQGVVRRINRTTVSVEVQDTLRGVVVWRVAPSLLSNAAP